jgi:hypothetical protein
MNAERTIPTLLNQIREELLRHIAYASELQTTKIWQRFRSQLHNLHYYCVRAQIPNTVSSRQRCRIEQLNFGKQPKVLFSVHADSTHIVSDDCNWDLVITRDNNGTFRIGMVVDEM